MTHSFEALAYGDLLALWLFWLAPDVFGRLTILQTRPFPECDVVRRTPK